MTYCKHYHIDCGERQCWAVADRLGVTTIEQLKHYARPTGCDGHEAICDFKKFGVKEKHNERNQTNRPV